MHIITGSLHSVLLTFYEGMVMKVVSCYITLCKENNTANYLQKSIKNVRQINEPFLLDATNSIKELRRNFLKSILYFVGLLKIIHAKIFIALQ